MASRGPDFYAGFHSMQIEHTLARFKPDNGQDYVNLYLSSLRPEVAEAMVRDADTTFRPRTAKLVKQYKEEWDGTE